MMQWISKINIHDCLECFCQFCNTGLEGINSSKHIFTFENINRNNEAQETPNCSTLLLHGSNEKHVGSFGLWLLGFFLHWGLTHKLVLKYFIMNILELPQTRTMKRLLFLELSLFSQMIHLFFLTQTEQLLAKQWAFNLLRIYQDRHRLGAEMPSSYPPPLGSHRLAQGNGNPCKHS